MNLCKRKGLYVVGTVFVSDSRRIPWWFNYRNLTNEVEIFYFVKFEYFDWNEFIGWWNFWLPKTFGKWVSSLTHFCCTLSQEQSLQIHFIPPFFVFLKRWSLIISLNQNASYAQWKVYDFLCCYHDVLWLANLYDWIDRGN